MGPVPTDEQEVIFALMEMVGQHCTVNNSDTQLDSMCLSANANAMQVLAQRGLITITHERGRRIIGKWTRLSDATSEEKEIQ